MSFRDCLDTVVEGGELSRADADRLWGEFQRLRAGFRDSAPGLADAEAKRALEELLAAETAHEKLKAKLALETARRIGADLDAYRTGKGEQHVGAAALALLEHNGEAPFSSVEGRRKAILGMAHGRLEAMLYTFRRHGLAGDVMRHNRAVLSNVVREAFGEATGDARAAELARAWTETAEWLRQRFNAAGGAIGRLENWGLPQHHDAHALLRAGRQAWKQAITPRLDLSRMRHPLSGQAIGAAELDEVLDTIWASIVTDGWDTREPTRAVYGKGALANQRGEHRFLVFRSPDDWMAYQRDFGGGSDPFAAMMGHVSMMARDIAAMEVLGPNPGASVEWLKQLVRKEAERAQAGLGGRIPEGADAENLWRRADRRIDAVWGSIRGALNTPAHTTWGAIGAGVRTWITSSVLGGAALSAVSDIGTSAVTRAFSGIDASRSFHDIVRAALPAGRREAVAANLILDNALHVFHAQARYVGTLQGPKWLEYVGDRVLTLSGLTPWTQAARHGFGMAFQHELAGAAGKAFADLHPLLRERLEAYGFTPADWDVMRRTPAHVLEGGVQILRPQDLARAGGGERLAERYLEMILSETEYAVPSQTHRSRTILLDQNRPGTVPGELLRSFAQFKSFGAVYAMLHGQRMARMLMARERDVQLRGAAYAAALATSTLVFGALALQLKQVAAGRDPRAMDSPAFWGAAFLQGGGVGIYGDFFFSDLNRYGGGFAGNIGGPVAERIGDFTNLTFGNAIELANGEDLNKARVGREFTRFLKSNTPGGNIWYSRLIWERMLMDNLQYLLDPEANKAFKASQQFWRRNYGQDYWWAPGTGLPQRAPDAGAPLGG